MKKITSLLVVLMFAVSCEKSATDFKGFGALNIGETFAASSDSTVFRKIMDDEFYSDRFDLSKDIGIVSDLSVSTDNGKISEVKFLNTDETNSAELEKVLATMKYIKIDEAMEKRMDGPEMDMKMYTSLDENVLLTVVKHPKKKLKSGSPVYEYNYISKAAVEKNREKLMKRIGAK